MIKPQDNIYSKLAKKRKESQAGVGNAYARSKLMQGVTRQEPEQPAEPAGPRKVSTAPPMVNQPVKGLARKQASAEVIAPTKAQAVKPLIQQPVQSLASQRMEALKPMAQAANLNMQRSDAVKSAEPDPTETQHNTGLDEYDPSTEVKEEDVYSATTGRGLELLTGGSTVSPEDLQRARTLANMAQSRQLADQQALVSAGGFGASGAGMMAQGDLARQGAMQTEQELSNMARAGRLEQLQRIMSGAQLGQAGLAGQREGERWAREQELIDSILRQGEGGGGSGGDGGLQLGGNTQNFVQGAGGTWDKFIGGDWRGAGEDIWKAGGAVADNIAGGNAGEAIGDLMSGTELAIIANNPFTQTLQAPLPGSREMGRSGGYIVYIGEDGGKYRVKE